jgi:hypothetical protein
MYIMTYYGEYILQMSKLNTLITSSLASLYYYYLIIQYSMPLKMVCTNRPVAKILTRGGGGWMLKIFGVWSTVREKNEA